MGVLDANPPLPEFRDDYVLQEVDRDWLSKAVKPKQFIHIDQSECIMCEGCVDICPWKCIHMVKTEAIAESIGTEKPGDDPSDHVIFTIDELSPRKTCFFFWYKHFFIIKRYVYRTI